METIKIKYHTNEIDKITELLLAIGLTSVRLKLSQ